MTNYPETVTAFLSNGHCVSIAKQKGLPALLLRASTIAANASIIEIFKRENAVMWVSDGEPHTEWRQRTIWKRPKGAPDFPLRHFKDVTEAGEWFAQMIETCDPESAEDILSLPELNSPAD
ncbi:hypothetical protein [Collinsella aerofaciens]|uniref:hypothetical protein n=1 Tax=Collinsella aerofaciens TaxID=74426 RepID=UPI003D7A16C5